MMPMGVSPTNCLAMGSAMSSSLRPPLRTWPDRVRQVVLFEGIGLLLITPLFAWAAGQEMGTSLGLMALMAALAADARDKGLKITPICGYAAAWLRRTPEFRDLIG